MSGWYKQWRDLFDREWTKDPKMVSVYLYLHCRAYVHDGMLHGQFIRRGSCMTSRTAIMEGTGLTEREVKTRMQQLVKYGEIITKASNYGTIVTVCDYDVYETQEDLFGNETSSQRPNEGPANVPTNVPSYILKEGRIKDNNIILSPFGPYNNERERRAMVKEIQAKYNQMFDGRLPSYTKMYLKMEMNVAECVRRFGRQSVDMVLEQVSLEPFSLGENKTGFKASFQYIFEPSEFQKYLERAQLRMKKAKKAEAEHQRTEQSAGGSDANATEVVAGPSGKPQGTVAGRQSPEEYERSIRAAAAEGNGHAIRLVKIWDEEKEKKQKQQIQ